MKPAVAEVAAEWLVRRQAGLDPAEQAEFERWLETPAHAAAYRDAEAGWEALNAPRLSGQAGTFVAAIGRKQRRRRQQMVAGLGLMAACLILALTLPWGPRATPGPTVAVRPDRQVLPDGSTVELNLGAEVAVDYTAAERRVRLTKGEALFAVAKNPDRPFIVAAGSVEVRAVGTAFAVRHGTHDVSVVVTEGRVAVVQREAAAPEPVYVTAGNAVTVQAATVNAPAKLAPAEIAAELAWRGKRVEFTDTPLGEAVALFNRQNGVQIEVGDAALEKLRLNGIFWADDPEAFCRLLADGMNVQVERDGTRVVLRGR